MFPVLDFWQWSLVFVAAAFVFVVYRLHASDHTDFQFEHLFMDDASNRASSKRLIAFGAFFFSTWVLLYLTVKDKVTENFYVFYLGAWVFNYVAPVVMERFGQKKPEVPDGQP